MTDEDVAKASDLPQPIRQVIAAKGRFEILPNLSVAFASSHGRTSMEVLSI